MTDVEDANGQHPAGEPLTDDVRAFLVDLLAKLTLNTGDPAFEATALLIIEARRQLTA